MQRVFLTVTAACPPLRAPVAFAHDDQDTHDVATDPCAAVKASVEEAGFSDSVAVTCTDTHAIIRSDTYPDHDKMTGITATNEQVPVPADYAAPILLEPTLGDTPLARAAALGMANGGTLHTGEYCRQ